VGPEDRLQRLDPDKAAASAPGRPRPPATFSPRRMQWVAGGLAIVLVVGFSVYRFGAQGVGTAGIPAGKPVRMFAAPLAASNLNGDANMQPPCTPARHDRRALNLCLLLKRGPLVLGFFVTDSGACERAVDAMQALASRYRAAGVQFAAVAVHTGHAAAAAAVRRHHWTIPVAYDRDGAVGASYGVEVCPLLELISRRGVVAERLIGKRWSDPRTLAGAVGRLAGS